MSPTATQPVPTRGRHADTMPCVIRSEWTKFWSVLSTPWSLIILVVVTWGFSVLLSWATAANFDQLPEEEQLAFDSTSTSLGGISFGQLVIAVLGVLVISTEYSTGAIKTSLAAVPQRMRLLFGKALVFAVVALAVGIVTSFGAFYLGQAFLASENLDTTLDAPNVLRAVFGGGIYLAGSGMLGFAVGALVRHTAGAITTAVAMLFVLPPLSQLLPGDWGDTVSKYLTSNAGSTVTVARQTDPDALGPWEGYAVFTLYWVVILAVAAVLMKARDA
jgi:ABC-2 type transport system permease protein